MANTYFQFKQFRVEQSLAAMKVCTESCVLGAVAEKSNAQRVLDIGTGTGLLSLMQAQKTTCPIDAVEVEDNAYAQADINFKASPWKERLSLFHASIQDFAISTSYQYDLIVCNPPFFSKHLTSPDKARNMALHNQTLSHETLAASIKALMVRSGLAYILQPPFEAEKFDLIAEQHGLYIQNRLLLINHPKAPPLRYVSVYGFDKKVYETATLAIRDQEGEYSKNFQKLLSPYYLYL